MRVLTAIQLDDEAAERNRREVHAAIGEIQASPALGIVTIPNVQLADGVATTVTHSLNRAPSFVTSSIPRGATTAGYIVEVRAAGTSRTNQIQLTASGYGATITVDLEVR